MEEETKNGNLAEEKIGAEKNDGRKGDERRRRKSLGHMYISTVGWICRREKDRRNKDCQE